MSTLKTGALRGTSGTADSIQLHASDQSVTFPGAVTVSGGLTGGGKILQVVNNLITDTYSEALSTTHWATLSSFANTSITPSSASNKILISGWVSAGIEAPMTIFLRIRRGSTAIGVADADGDRRQGISAGVIADAGNTTNIPFFYIDSPNTTSSTTYGVQLGHPSSSTRTITVNKGGDDGDNARTCRTCSNIVLQEIAA